MIRTISWAVLALALLTAAPAEAYQPLWQRTSLTFHANVNELATGDFNSDGRADVVTWSSSTAIHLWLTNADGTMGSPTSVYTGSGFTNLLVSDIDADGDGDLLLGRRTPHALIFIPSNGEGTFGTPITTAVAIDPTPGRVAIADFNGDTKVDVVVGSYYDLQAEIYAGDGAGNFTLLLNRSLPSAPTVVVAGDIDADGKSDYVIGYSDSTPYEAHFGNGDGTFTSTFPLLMLTTGAARIALADLDVDGDRDLVVPHYENNTLSVLLNNGSRTFASPVVYNVLPRTPVSGNPWDIVVADVNDDDDLDVVLTLAGEHLLATYTGNGDGSLNPGVYVRVGSAPPGVSYPARHFAAADFTGDGRMDVAVSTSLYVSMWAGRPGDVTVFISSPYRTISQDQVAEFEVRIQDAQTGFDIVNLPPPATGTVTLTENGVQIGSGTVTNSMATIEVPSLAPGMHTIVAHYSGDDAYRATDSAPVQQNVTAESTTVTLVNSASGELAYWQPFGLTATVSSAIQEPLTGMLWFYRNGELVYSADGPEAHYTPGAMAPGAYTFRVEYRGTDTQPPATSNEVTQVIVKAGSSTSIADAFVRYSQQTPVSVTLTGAHGGSPSGTVRLYEGAALIGTVVAPSGCCGPSVVQIPISLPIGVHYLRAGYEGNDRYEASTSGAGRYTVVPNEGFFIDAYSSGTTIIARGVYNAPNGGHFKIHRRIGSGGWSVFQTSTPQWIEENAAPSTAYTFRMEVYDASNQLIASSNTDTAMRVTFTDDPLTAGTRIKSVHLAELVAAANALRSAAGLSAINIDASPRQLIRATHLLQLRTAINEARVALGAAAISFSGAVGAGLPVRATHIQELRDALR